MKYRSLSACLLLSAVHPQTLLAAEPAPQLETVHVSAERKAALLHGEVLDAEQLRRARGTGNADIFSALPSVQVNNIRNEAGAIDLGIRGLQGEGRVPVLIDGDLQSTHTARGYQGTSDRTYIDSDLISKVSVEEEPATAPSPAARLAAWCRCAPWAWRTCCVPARISACC